MHAQYVSLCSNNDVILRARGEGGQKGPKICVHTNSILLLFTEFVKSLFCNNPWRFLGSGLKCRTVVHRVTYHERDGS